mgnify:FL=1
MRRTEAREALMMLIFQMDSQKDYSEEAAAPFMDCYMEGSDQMDYFNAVLENYKANKTAIDEKLEEASKGWHLERLAKVDLAVLRLAVTEICYMDNAEELFRVPAGAAINEAVNLAKKFGSEESGKFVNGILGKIVRG